MQVCTCCWILPCAVRVHGGVCWTFMEMDSIMLLQQQEVSRQWQTREVMDPLQPEERSFVLLLGLP
jgi:hypothetical protein